MATCSPIGPVYKRRYGAATVIPIVLSKNSLYGFIAGSGWTPASGDVQVSFNTDGTEFSDPAIHSTLPIAASSSGYVWYLAFSASEMQCKSVAVTITDNTQNVSTAAIESYSFVIETYGDPSAMVLHNYDLSNAIATSSPTSYGAITDVDQVCYQSSDAPSLSWTILDSAGAVVDLTGATVVFTVLNHDGTTLFSRTSATSAQVTIGGTDNNVVTATYTATNTATAGCYRYTLRKTNSGAARTLATGDLRIRDYLNQP